MNYCLGFAFNEDFSKIVLIKKDKPAFLKDLYNGIGGKLEKNETILQSMEREFLEETGVLIKEEQWTHFANFNEKDFNIDCFYCNDNSVLNCKTTEQEEISIFNTYKIDKIPLANSCFELIVYILKYYKPPVKINCSILAEDAIKAAIKYYKDKHNI